MIFWIIGALSAAIMLLTAGIRSRSFTIPAGIIWCLLFTFGAYTTLPTLAFDYAGIYLIVLLNMGVGSLLRFFVSEHDSDGLYDYFAGWKLFLPALGLALIALFVSSSGMIHNDDYRRQLNVTEVETFDPESVLLDQGQARFVDQTLAGRAASELLGKEIGIGSRYNVGTMHIQSVDGKLTWVAPFVHKSVFRWMDDGTAPGYVMVNSNNYDDAKMVTKGVDINYGTEGFYFGHYVPRHLYVNGYSTVGTTDYTLEIRDDGQPFWVVSKLKKNVGVGGTTVDGVITVNATTGDIVEYAISDAPDWIDRIQPEGLVHDRISDWGRFIGSWFNAYFIGTDVIVPTEGTLLVYTVDGRAMWYTGMQSDSSGQSNTKDGTMGFFLVDSRTGDATFYRRSGITESAAKTAIEGRVQEYGYTASAPIPYNVNGKSTFISILKDKNGNAQMVGMVAYDNRTLVAVGKTLQSSMRSYLSVLSSNAGENEVIPGVEKQTVIGTVDRLGFQSMDQKSIIYFTLAEPEYANKIFSASSETNLGTVLTRSGDRVELTVMSLDHKEISVSGFKNLSM